MVITRSLFRLAVGAAAGYLLAVRPWHLRWGADDSEVHAGMAGDDIVHASQYQATRAVTIDAPPASVWAWLIQLGGYTPGGPTERPAAATGHPGSTEWPGATDQGEAAGQQGLKVGDVLHAAPDGTGFVVEQIDPPNTLVLALRGPDATTTCSIALRDLDGKTRMVFRLRIRAQPTLRGITYLATMDVGDFVAMRRQMLTIKARAESAHSAAPAGGPGS
ncbi:SRPBCC domain-containing protein [Nonomuraea sp. M3C6]|uniref:SRPBCC domain-containing protein n=1 Tax=Nonomuraea marmarensis TaxID=3351344 RepID=A0ABW7ASA1_9ACTN